MRTRYPDEPKNSCRIGSVRTFLEVLEKTNCPIGSQLFFRGHESFKYELKPSIYRDKGWVDNEDIMFKELILRCPNDFNSTETTFQTLVKMQHYALPTRLLDITSNPLIALFFATEQTKKKSEHAEVLVFQIPKTEIKYYDSDTVSVISNIAKRPQSFSLPRENLSKENFNKDDKITYLLHEIKNEKPYFQPLIKREHIESVVCVKPKMDNPRIIRQDGAFFLFGIDKNKDSSAAVPHNYSISLNTTRLLIIPREKKKIREQLRALGITKGTVYPEIEKVSEFIKDQFSSEEILTNK